MTSNIEDNQEIRINKSALQRIDSDVKVILARAKQVALYDYNVSTKEWKETEFVGTLFIYTCKNKPFFRMVIMNRVNTSNYKEPLTNDIEWQRETQFLLYTNQQKIYGLWFYNADECIYISNLVIKIQEYIISNKDNSNFGENLDTVNFLQEAQEYYFETMIAAVKGQVLEVQPGTRRKLRRNRYYIPRRNDKVYNKVHYPKRYYANKRYSKRYEQNALSNSKDFTTHVKLTEISSPNLLCKTMKDENISMPIHAGGDSIISREELYKSEISATQNIRDNKKYVEYIKQSQSSNLKDQTPKILYNSQTFKNSAMKHDHYSNTNSSTMSNDNQMKVYSPKYNDRRVAQYKHSIYTDCELKQSGEYYHSVSTYQNIEAEKITHLSPTSYANNTFVNADTNIYQLEQISITKKLIYQTPSSETTPTTAVKIDKSYSNVYKSIAMNTSSGTSNSNETTHQTINNDLQANASNKEENASPSYSESDNTQYVYSTVIPNPELKSNTNQFDVEYSPITNFENETDSFLFNERQNLRVLDANSSKYRMLIKKNCDNYLQKFFGIQVSELKWNDKLHHCASCELTGSDTKWSLNEITQDIKFEDINTEQVDPSNIIPKYLLDIDIKNLLNAFKYLLKTDTTLIKKLRNAYFKSLKDSED